MPKKKTFNVDVVVRNLARARKGKALGRVRRPKAAYEPDFVAKAWNAALEIAGDKRRELAGLLMLLGGLGLALALLPLGENLLGPAGQALFRFFFGALGLAAPLVPAGLLVFGWAKLGGREVHAPSVKLAGWGLVAVAATALINLVRPEAIAAGPAEGLYWGGLLGRLLGGAMLKSLATAGTLVLCLALLAVAVYLLEQEGQIGRAHV